MARGYIYYIRKYNEPDVSFDKTQYYDQLDILGIDFVKNLDEEESNEQLSALEKSMVDLGAVVSRDDADETYAFSFGFENAEKAKHDYFMPRLDQFKKQVEALKLSDVMREDPALEFIERSRHGDRVSGFTVWDVSFDDFIRALQSGVTYYVHRQVILMH